MNRQYVIDERRDALLERIACMKLHDYHLARLQEEHRVALDIMYSWFGFEQKPDEVELMLGYFEDGNPRGFYYPTEEIIQINGYDMTTVSPESVRNLGWVERSVETVYHETAHALHRKKNPLFWVMETGGYEDVKNHVMEYVANLAAVLCCKATGLYRNIVVSYNFNPHVVGFLEQNSEHDGIKRVEYLTKCDLEEALAVSDVRTYVEDHLKLKPALD